jgi:hypothetical protein
MGVNEIGPSSRRFVDEPKLANLGDFLSKKSAGREHEIASVTLFMRPPPVLRVIDKRRHQKSGRLATPHPRRPGSACNFEAPRRPSLGRLRPGSGHLCAGTDRPPPAECRRISSLVSALHKRVPVPLLAPRSLLGADTSGGNRHTQDTPILRESDPVGWRDQADP